MSMLQTEEGLIGLSIREKNIRMTETVMVQDKFQVLRTADGELTEPFSYEILQNRSSIKRIADELNNLVAGNGFNTSKVSVTIDSDLVLIKKVPTDATLSGPDLGEHITWEIDQLLVSPRDHFIVDFEQNDTDEMNDSQERQVVVVVIRKEIVDYLREVFAATKLQLCAIDVDVFSAQRVLAKSQDVNLQEKQALVDIRKKNIQISVIYNGFCLCTEVNLPSEDGLDIVANRDEQLARVLTKELRRIVLDNKLGKTIDDLQGIYFYGQDVNKNMIDLISQAHNANLQALNPFGIIEIAEVTNNTAAMQNPENFVTSVGAAIKGF